MSSGRTDSNLKQKQTNTSYKYLVWNVIEKNLIPTLSGETDLLIDLLMRGEKKKKKKGNPDPDHLKQTENDEPNVGLQLESEIEAWKGLSSRRF